MILISPISPKALEEAKVLAVKALKYLKPSKHSSAVILRKVRDAGDMSVVWGVLVPEQQYLFLDQLKAVEPKTEYDARPFKEIAAWVRRYARGLQDAAWPVWDDSEV